MGFKDHRDGRHLVLSENFTDFTCVIIKLSEHPFTVPSNFIELYSLQNFSGSDLLENRLIWLPQ